MRVFILICTMLMVIVNVKGVFAGGNDMFEAKTSTSAIAETSKKLLSSTNRQQRKAMKKAAQASRSVLKAYKKCPAKPNKAGRALEKSIRKLERYQRLLANVSASDVSIAALAEFAYATMADIEAMLASDSLCDEGKTLLQSELDYTQAAPFVSFARGWGTMQYGAHGTFGDFSANSTAPDHVHGETYYGVVIRGTLKNPFGEMPNNDLDIAKSLPAGSFWQVPANAVHTTACDGDENCAFYFHSVAAFDFDTDISDGEIINSEANEIPADEIAEALGKDSSIVSPFARMYTVWGDRSNGAHGTMGEFIPGGASPEHTHGHSYHGIVLSGTMVNPFLGQAIEDARPLQAGDYWFVPAGIDHVTACISAEPCTFYFHSEGLFDFIVTGG